MHRNAYKECMGKELGNIRYRDIDRKALENYEPYTKMYIRSTWEKMIDIQGIHRKV